VNVVVPASPADAKGLLKTVLRGSNPCFFLEAGGRGAETAEVPDGDYTIPLGKVSVLRKGRDITIVAVGTMVKHAVAAAAELEDKGVDAEVVDVRTLVPLDEAGIVASVRKTGRLLVVDEARDRCSAASHICAVVADQAFDALKAPPRRVTVPNTAMPYAPAAERNVLPNPAKIAAAAAALAGK
jgi:pyruvate dehydrogenase E1 component beta subunit